MRRSGTPAGGGSSARAAGRSTYTTMSAGWLAVSSRARGSPLLTTPGRLRRRSRPSKPTRGTTSHHLIERPRELASQDASIEAGDLRLGAVHGLAAFRVGMPQNARDRVDIIRWRQPATRRPVEDIGGG